MSLSRSQRHERRWHSGVEARPIACKAKNQVKARCAVPRRGVVYLHPRGYKNHNRLRRDGPDSCALKTVIWLEHPSTLATVLV